MLKNRIIYSLRIYLELKKRGIEPVATTENPFKEGFICWIYEKTPELIAALDELMGGA